MNRNALIDELRRDEGERFVVYGDGDGKPIIPGKVMVGHPTIAIGRALDVNPLTPAESIALTNSSLDTILATLNQRLPWALGIGDVRYRVLANMAYNMGVPGLCQFINMLNAVMSGEYGHAADEMLDSKWATQVGARADRLAKMMRTGAV